MKKQVLFLTFLLFTTTFIFSQDWVNYQRNDFGTTSSSVWHVAHASNGISWLGMKTTGLVKYDAGTWTVYNTGNSDLKNDGILGVAVDQNNNVWLSVNSMGIQLFDGTNWTTPDGTNINVDFVNGDLIMPPLVGPNGNVYINTNEGIAEYDGTDWSIYTPSNSNLPAIKTMAFGNDFQWDVASDGTIWYEKDRVVYSFNPGTNTGNSYDGAAHGLTDAWGVFRAFFVDDADNLWLGTEQHGVFKYDGNTWTNLTTSNSNLPNNDIREIGQDCDGNLWLSKNLPGVALYKYDGVNTFTTYAADGVYIYNINGISSITQDADGDMWFSIDGKGVTMFQKGATVTNTFSFNETNGTIFPNPCTEVLHLKNEKHQVEGIFDLSGLPQSYSANGDDIDVSSLIQGNYIIMLSDPQGNTEAIPFEKVD